jgi:hypothetical protein
MSVAKRKYSSREVRTHDEVVAAFWAKVEKGEPNECWRWKAAKHPKRGYGQFVSPGSGYAHRFSYELVHGKLPPRSCVLHLCENPDCVNPKHLKLGVTEDKPGRPAKIKWNDVELSRMYLEEKLSCQGIAEKIEVDHSSVHRRLKNLGIIKTRSSAALGKISSRRSESHVNKGGYRMVRLPNDSPYISMGVLVTRWKPESPKCYFVPEHRLVVAKSLGRPLERWEIVHHINHVRLDNRIENLKLMQSSTVHIGETVSHNEMLKMKKRIKELEGKILSLGGEI